MLQTQIDPSKATAAAPISVNEVTEPAHSMPSPALQRIEAVVMFCDLRGFTALSNALPQGRVIDVLRGYFDRVVPIIESHGGEVLQFIGDGVLGVFRDCTDRDGASCSRAMKAATEIQLALHVMPVAGIPLQAGIALHAGEVFYGHIGSGERTSFTVIGPVVNLTSRLEGLCHVTEQPILMSGTFAKRIGCSKARLVGHFDLKGFAEPQDVYAPVHAANR